MVYSEKMRALLKARDRALAGYLTAGYPDRETFFRVLEKCEAAGLSIFEIGFPSENPYADGQVIREAHQKVDKSICTDLDFWKRIRETMKAPVWIMGYYGDLKDTGACRKLARAGVVDVFVIPDASFQQAADLQKELAPWGVDVMGFLSEGMEKEETDQVLSAFGLIYQQLYHGVTGVPSSGDSYKELLAYGLAHGGSHLFAGFGISCGARVKELLENGFYGAIVGTAIMKALNQSQEALLALLDELRGGMESAKRR